MSCWRSWPALAALCVWASCGRDGCKDVCVSLNPAAGSGPHQEFEVRLSGPAAGRIATARVLINGVREGAHACYIYYEASGAFLLVHDSGMGSAPLPLGGAVQNGQCRLDGAGTSATPSKDGLVLRLNLVFDPGFYGEKQIFVAYDSRAGKQTELRSVGSWWVP